MDTLSVYMQLHEETLEQLIMTTEQLETVGVMLESIQADIRNLDETELDSRLEDIKYSIDQCLEEITF